jgi:Flp pilus assembly protein TadG
VERSIVKANKGIRGTLTKGRGRRERGTALIEMAMIFPMLILILVGIFELGGAFRDMLTTSNAVRDGVRILTAKGDDLDADCAALLAAVDTLTLGGRFEDLQRIEIYKADSSGNQMGPSTTNTYTFSVGDPEDCNDWNGYPATNYPPTSRYVLAGGATPLDIIGMRIVHRHDWFTQFPPFSGFITIDETAISRVEPEGFA